MGRIGQIALGAVVAVGISGVSLGMDGARFGQPEYAAWQQTQRLVDAKLDFLGTTLVEGTRFAVRVASY